MLVKVNNEEYDVRLLETETDLIILVDNEPFSIELGNETHDQLGRFSNKAGSAIKKVGKKVTKGVVGSAVSGGIFGGLGGALKEGVMGDRSEGNALARAKKGLIKGAIRGAKRGAMKKLVKNTLDIGAEHAGSYGWAVRAIGGLGIAVAGKKKSFGLEPGDFQKIGREMFSAGFSEFVSAQLEYDEPIYLQEGDFKNAVGGLAAMIADFLDNSEEEYMGLEDGAGLEDLGFIEKDGLWYIHRDDAEDLLASLLAYGETKLEVFAEETVKLFNPNHDEQGRFTVRIGGRAIFTGPKRQPFELAGNEYARVAFKVAGAGAVTYKVLDSLQKSITNPKVQQRLQFGKNVAGTTALAAGGIGGFLKAGVYGRASANNLAKMGKEIKTEVTYKGANKKPLVNRIVDIFNYGRRAFGYGGLSALGAVGGITASMLLYRAFGGKGKISDSIYSNLNRAGQYASQVMGEGWMTRMAGMFGFNLEEKHPLLSLFDNSEVLEGIFTFWAVLDAYVEEGDGFSLEDFSLTPEETEELHETLTHFIVGFLEDQDEAKLTLYEEDTIRLYNPNHDALGRFAVAAGVTGIVAGTAGLVGNAVGGVAKSREAMKVAKERFGTAKIKQRDYDKILKELNNKKMFSKKIGGTEVSMTYGQWEKSAKTLAFAGFASSLLSRALFSIREQEAAYDDFRQRHEQAKKTYKERYEEARQRAEEAYRQREANRGKTKSTASWPAGATEDDFRNMYRKVAKRYHPDLGGDTETMKKINEAYSKRDWNTINDYFVQLEATDDDPQEAVTELLCEVLREFLDGDAEYLTFPDDGTDDFIVDEETGLAVMDRITAQFIYDILEGEENGETTSTERETETD